MGVFILMANSELSIQNWFNNAWFNIALEKTLSIGENIKTRYLDIRTWEIFNFFVIFWLINSPYMCCYGHVYIA